MRAPSKTNGGPHTIWTSTVPWLPWMPIIVQVPHSLCSPSAGSPTKVRWQHVVLLLMVVLVAAKVRRSPIRWTYALNRLAERRWVPFKFSMCLVAATETAGKWIFHASVSSHTLLLFMNSLGLRPPVQGTSDVRRRASPSNLYQE